jgi:hypothetical protein
MDDRPAAPRILYLDQNAWVALARGAWDKLAYPAEHAGLSTVVSAVQAGAVVVPLSFTNLYETLKINDPVRRATWRAPSRSSAADACSGGGGAFSATRSRPVSPFAWEWQDRN